MGVKKTQQWLKEFVRDRKESSERQYLDLQRKILCEPIAEYFDEYNSVSLHKYFLENGLFFPDANIEDDIKELEKKQVWQLIKVHYENLKKAWNGASAHIFIFPVEKRNKMIMEELKGKMGISFHNVIVLFIASDLTEEDIRALLTHEYNHVCRLSQLKRPFSEITLLDSMLIEGMAEAAVKEMLGESYLAPWVSLYSEKELQAYWPRVKNHLHVKGKEKHNPILYGERGFAGIPKWFGYCIGYHIVQAYKHKNKEVKMKELLKRDSEELLKALSFASG